MDNDISHGGKFVKRFVRKREVIRARERRRRELRRTIQDRRKVVDSLLDARRGSVTGATPGEASEVPAEPPRPARTLKRYADD
jgi:hypothetical protein